MLNDFGHAATNSPANEFLHAFHPSGAHPIAPTVQRSPIACFQPIAESLRRVLVLVGIFVAALPGTCVPRLAQFWGNSNCLLVEILLDGDSSPGRPKS